MELMQLKYFKAVAEIGKISAAAESLFISPPALSTSISRLEKELGMPLFERTNNRIILNQQGQIFLRYVNQVFSSLECAKVELRQSMLQQGKHVSVAMTTTNLWTDMITAFSQEHPNFTLSTTTLRVGNMSGGILPQHSFLFAAEEDLDPSWAGELESVALFEDQPAIMVHPAHPLAKLETVEVSMLQKESLFLPMQDMALYWRLEKVFEAEGLAMPNANSFSYLVYRHMVEEELGISFISLRASRMEPDNLRYIPLVNHHHPWIMRIFWRGNRELTEEERIFKDFVVDFYRGLL